MKKTLYTIYVKGELQPYQVWAMNLTDAILIIKGKLISMGYCSEIERVSYYNEHLLCTEAYYNINVKVSYEEVL